MLQSIGLHLVRSIIVSSLIILAACAGVILLLEKGGKAGASRVRQVSGPVKTTAATAPPIKPQTIQGQIDDFNQAITLGPITTWDQPTKYGFMLAVSGNPKLNPPHARVTLTHPTAAPVVLEIQYTVPQNIVEMIRDHTEAASKFHGVTIQVATQGSGSNSCALLELDPLRNTDHRRWLSYLLTLPTETSEILFWITSLPPYYDVSWANCCISLPQLRVAPNATSATPGPYQSPSQQP